MRILMICDHLPYPPSSGTSIRNYNLLKRLAREHEVWIAAFAKREQDAENIAHLRGFCAGVETVEMSNSHALERPMQALEYLTKGWPVELRHYRSPALVDKIGGLTERLDFDVVEIVDSFMGLYLEALPAVLRRRSVVTFIDVVFSKVERIARLEPRLPRKLRMWLYGRMMRDWEPYYMERFGRCIAVSESDRSLLLSRNPRLQIDVVPNGIDAQQFQPLPYNGGSPLLLFVGNMAYRPNIDAMAYFCRDIYPKIQREISDLEMWIVGINPSPEVKQLEGNGVHVTGSVDDVRPLYGLSTVCVVPLRAGGGTRLKILEAMALGRPVVSTSIGCEGLEVVDGEHLLIADTPEEFADKILRLLTDKDLMRRIVVQARKFVVIHYDWDVIAQKLIQTYEGVSS